METSADVTFPEQYVLFLVLAPLATALALGTLFYARSRHPSPETSVLAGLMLAITGWVLFNTLELLASSEDATVFWAKASYVFIAYTPVAWLAFALRYTAQHKWLTRPLFAIFCIIPAITTLLAWTNDLHHWLWADYQFISAYGLLALDVVHGPWFWVHGAHSYGLMFLGALLIVRQSFRSFNLYRQQSIWLILGALILAFINVFYSYDLIPALKKDFTPVGLAFTGIALAIGMTRYRLFDLKPVARDAVVDSMSDSMLAIDMQGRVFDLNAAAAAVIGVQAGGAIGRPAAEVLDPWRDQVEHFRDAFDLRTEIGVTQDGDARYFDLQVSPLHNRRKQMIGRLVVWRDTTERRRIETNLERQIVELEARNEELDAFAHTVAHDLKNPLASLVPMSDHLQAHFQSIPAEEVHRMLGIIERSARKMDTIIDELLLLASVRKFEDVQITPLDTRKIVDEALERLSHLEIEHPSQISVPDRWPVALGYAPWIEEVWVNYISNALKYSGARPHIELGARLQFNDPDERQPIARFWVRDNGPGIPVERHRELFTLFNRLGTASPQGHGLGLSIVQRIVTRLGGEVGVESELGQGSLFWFSLPALETMRR
jgi:PAS domain S-box-containing protein